MASLSYVIENELKQTYSLPEVMDTIFYFWISFFKEDRFFLQLYISYNNTQTNFFGSLRIMQII